MIQLQSETDLWDVCNWGKGVHHSKPQRHQSKSPDLGPFESKTDGTSCCKEVNGQNTPFCEDGPQYTGLHDSARRSCGGDQPGSSGLQVTDCHGNNALNAEKPKLHCVLTKLVGVSCSLLVYTVHCGGIVGEYLN